MNNIYTLETLAAELSKRADVSIDEARDYLQAIFHQIAKTLTANSAAAIPGIGRFEIADNGSEILFTPTDALADAVNEPFSFFEPTIVDSETNLEISSAATPLDKQPNDSILRDDTQAKEPVVDTADNVQASTAIVVNTPAEQADDNTPAIADNVSAPTVQDEDKVTGYDTTEVIDEYNDEPIRYRRHFNPAIAFILGVLTGMVLTCIAVYFIYPPLPANDDYYIEPQQQDITTAPLLTDSCIQTVSVPESEPTVPDTTTFSPSTVQAERTDTVTSTYFLASMSRKYYERMDFWVYIYKENEDKLGHPDRISAGTVVVIPNRSKYNIDPNDPASVERARELSVEIFKRYE